MKTSELTGQALDWAVAKSLGGKIRTENGVFLNQGDGYEYFTPSTNWEQGGPIVEREKICTEGRPGSVDGSWAAHYSKRKESEYFYSVGLTPLIAAMRCYVSSKLGDEVDVPEELK